MVRQPDFAARGDVASLSDFITDDGAFLVDTDQRVVTWSSPAQRLLGHPAANVLGKRCYDVMAGRDIRNLRFCRRNCPIILNARRGRASPNFDILCPTANGSESWVNVSVLVVGGAGRPPQVLHLFRDVTHRRRTETAAQQAANSLRRATYDSGNGLSVNSEPGPTPQLSRRELEVLRLLACGMATKQIADTLGVSPVTARNHINRLMTKLGTESRLQTVLYASQHRLL